MHQPDVCSPADSVSSSSFPSPVWSKESPRAPTRELRQQETRPSTAAGGAVCPDWGIAHQFAQLPTAAAAEGCGQLVRPAARPQQAAAAEPTAPPPPPAISSPAAVVAAVVASPQRAERLVGQLGQHWENEARTSAGLSMGAPEVCASPRSAAECRLELTRLEVEWEPEEEEEVAEEEGEDEAEEEEEEEETDIASPAVCRRSVAHSSVQLSDSLCVEPEEQPGGAELLAAESGSSRTKAAKSAVCKLRSKIASRIKAAVRACVLRHLMM
ncbi:hypothetical protein PLESTM_000728400 [Pleodorina starrii]|nr:hypothetical protein PLESTM_000728400 [Pleodorina starrii]